MVDDAKNNGAENELEADFPSFLCSDNPENYDNDINHFLEDDKMLDVEDIGVGAEPEPAKFSGWNDGFEEEEKSEDLDLGLESENFDLPGLGGTEDEPWLQNPLDEENADAENIPAAPALEDIEPAVEAENIAAEEMEPVSENNAVPEAESFSSSGWNETETLAPESEIAYPAADDGTETANRPADGGEKAGVSKIDAEPQIKFMNDADPENEKAIEFPDPEEYMSFDVPLEKLSVDDHKTELPSAAEIPEDAFLPRETPVHIRDLPQETIPENPDEPYVEVLPGNQNMNPDEYMSYDLPEETISLETADAAETAVVAAAENESGISDVAVPAEQKPDDKPVAASPVPESRTEQEEKETLRMFKWYSGSLSDNYFKFSAEEASAEFNGNADQNSIYVNVGTSAYGWNVAFDNGINMNLADVREFQLRNGRLPAGGGTIMYGENALRFSNVERIVVGSIPEYFHYGI